MKDQMKYAIRFSIVTTVLYTLVDLVNWKIVLETIDLFFVAKIILFFILTGVLAYFVLTPKKKDIKQQDDVKDKV